MGRRDVLCYKREEKEGSERVDELKNKQLRNHGVFVHSVGTMVFVIRQLDRNLLIDHIEDDNLDCIEYRCSNTRSCCSLALDGEAEKVDSRDCSNNLNI